jgi:hypothetical protein
MIEIKSISKDDARVELFIDGESKGVFSTTKMAKKFIDNYVYIPTERVIVKDESSGVSQKNDEPTLVKRRGRPKKADNERGKLPSIR